MNKRPAPKYLWQEHERVEAVFDPTKTYRYLLSCMWEKEADPVTFVMLNPSVADENYCDPTLKRCLNFAKSWGYGSMKIVNLFALVSTEPEALSSHQDPTGPENDAYIIEASRKSPLIIYAWGTKYGSLNGRSDRVQHLLSSYPHYCIKKSSNGRHPCHPLFLPKKLRPVPF
ncbi:DUF1643 domain-containing protein [Halobacillus salinarum]|uniref:DUF1643 domain-containing protein n=1 Tax=Halobacillus salinarum TaxID=2932257 RepID=A0ABY4EM46_9BACI|nr:DUF1643 domain-containing protein [Halobacillus salinarum]UOQ45520.1 DUF1643 domain-containing protein [Halobacillus salinarum]